MKRLMIRDTITRLLYRTHGKEVSHETLMEVLGPKLSDPVKIEVKVVQ